MFTKRPLTTTTFFTSLPSMAWETASSAWAFTSSSRGVGGNRIFAFTLPFTCTASLDLVGLGLLGVELGPRLNVHAARVTAHRVPQLPGPMRADRREQLHKHLGDIGRKCLELGVCRALDGCRMQEIACRVRELP